MIKTKVCSACGKEKPATHEYFRMTGSLKNDRLSARCSDCYIKYPESVAYIYALIDPQTGNPYYVGKATDPVARFKTHLQDANISDGYDLPARIQHTKHLVRLGLKPELKVLEKVTYATSQAAEASWLDKFLDEGYPILNEGIIRKRQIIPQLNATAEDQLASLGEQLGMHRMDVIALAIDALYSAKGEFFSLVNVAADLNYDERKSRLELNLKKESAR